MKITGFDEFIKLFGNVTLLSVIEIILGLFFLYMIYKKIKEHLIKVHEAEEERDRKEEERDRKIEEALEAVGKYPEYRRQSVNIQKNLKAEIEELRTTQAEFKQSQENILKKLNEMEDRTNKRERNKLRDLLLQNYRYYTNKETNPTQSWTRMEMEAFWELFTDYEEANGDGYMHTEVQPAMNRLKIIEIGK